MTIRATLFAVPALAFCALCGQDSSSGREFHFAHLATADAMQQVANTIRTIGDIRQLSVDTGARNLTVNGTPAQLSLSDWLFQNLDQRAGELGPGAPDYPIPGEPGSAAAVLPMAHADTPAILQEMLNALRTTADIKYGFAFSAGRAIVVRGTSDQLALVRWLMQALDLAAGTQPAAPGSIPLEYKMNVARDNVVRVFYLQHTGTPAAMLEIVNSVRLIADINRLFPLNGPQAIAARGSAEQVALAEWLLSELDRAPATQTSESARNAPFAHSTDTEALVVHLAYIRTPEAMLEAVNTLKAMTRIVRATPLAGPRALALRGTAGQVEQAGKWIAERDRP